MIAQALQEEMDQQEALGLALEEERAANQGLAIDQPNFPNRQGRLNSTPHLRPATNQNNRPPQDFGQPNSRARSDVNEYEVGMVSQGMARTRGRSRPSRDRAYQRTDESATLYD